ncbi:hypothetical protein TNCV_234131 [Trichonephila clavipes]|uniref:Uncharacterized protein n=1 Tax=Trichonephila clavipes TaxID=2585209 RepID=A0A8X6SNU4_TRICX|nr:hypothetical protein TNCV_234131 [Trichonephila clavipes]
MLVPNTTPPVTYACTPPIRITVMSASIRLDHADWGRIVFNDESRLQQCPDDNRIHVCRLLGQRADPVFSIACHTGPRTNIIVRGSIFFGGWISLVFNRGTLIVQRRTFGANYKDSSASEDLKTGQEQPENSSENFCEIIDIPLFSRVLKQHVLCVKCKKQGIDIKFGRKFRVWLQNC